MAKKKPYRFVLYLLNRLAASFFSLLPRRAALQTAGWMGKMAFYVVARQRVKTLRHLAMAYGGEKSKPEIHRIAKGVFENLAKNAAEFVRFGKINSANIDSIVDLGGAEQVYRDLLREGKGIISITAHIGNWELLAGMFGLKGFKGAVLARRIYYEPYNDWVISLRMKLGVPTLFRNNASREILKRLAQNEIIGLLPDQDIDSLRGVFAGFFGRPAYTPVAPVRLALASGAPIVVNFLIRDGDKYRLVLSDVLRPKIETTREAALEKYTKLWMSHFEAAIRLCPDQWAWMHNRWKTQESDFKMQTVYQGQDSLTLPQNDGLNQVAI